MQQKTPSRVINFLVRLTLTKKKSKKGLRTLPSLHGFAFYYFDQWIFMGKGSHRSGKEKKYNRQSLSFVAKGETIKNLWKNPLAFSFLSLLSGMSDLRGVWHLNRKEKCCQVWPMIKSILTCPKENILRAKNELGEIRNSCEKTCKIFQASFENTIGWWRQYNILCAVFIVFVWAEPLMCKNQLDTSRCSWMLFWWRVWV